MPGFWPSVKAAGALLTVLIASACLGSGEGVSAPLDRFYFPVAMVRSPGATRLYVVNSDFDLQFNSGTLLALDLERVRELVPTACDTNAGCPDGKACDVEPTEENGGIPSFLCVDTAGPDAGQPCGTLGQQDADDQLLFPGPCAAVDLARPPDGGSSIVVEGARIGAFASNIIFRSRPPAEDGTEQPGARLFVPVRGDSTLHWIDVDDDTKAASLGVELDCGQDADGNCASDHRIGDEARDSQEELTLPTEPFGIDATADGRAVVMTHQATGELSLFVNDWPAPPRLQHILSGLPGRPVAVAAVPPPAYGASEPTAAKAPGFMVAFRSLSEVRLVRVQGGLVAGDRAEARPFLEGASTTAVGVAAGGFDSRGIVVDDDARRQCEALCGDAICERECAAVPLDVYLAHRSPASLLFGRTFPSQDVAGATDVPRFYEALPMPFGVSRVVLGRVIGPDGTPEKRLFVVSFDQRRLAIVDPASRTVERYLETGRGPQAFAVDMDPAADDPAAAPAYAYGYLSHFTDSYIGVIDLDQRHRRTYGTFVLNVGIPTPPRAAK